MSTTTRNPLADVEVWQMRATALDTLINDLGKRFSSQSSTATVEFAPMLQRLVAFRGALMDRFINGFEGDTLALSAAYPPDYVYDQLLAQAATDLNAIIQIAGQRQRLDNLDNLDNAHFERKTLERADTLAQAALAPTYATPGNHLPRNHLHLTPSKPISYYQKSASIRLMPYSHVVFVALPYTATHALRDYLAIPHEVGHHLYWRGQTQGARIEQAMRAYFHAAPPWLKSWLEEIFADVYGSWVAGPAIALSFQDLQLAAAGATFRHDDGTHPVPILRPLIYSKVLAKTDPAWEPHVAARWQKVLDLDSQPFVVNEQGAPVEIEIDEVISPGVGGDKPLDQVITWVLELLQDLAAPLRWRDYLGEITPDAASTDPKALARMIYDAFGRAISVEPPVPLDIPAMQPSDTPTVQQLIAAWEEETNAAPEPDAPTWLPLLRAGGWTTKGPHGRH